MRGGENFGSEHGVFVDDGTGGGSNFLRGTQANQEDKPGSKAARENQSEQSVNAQRWPRACEAFDAVRFRSLEAHCFDLVEADARGLK